MSDFVKYQLDDGQELFVETPPHRAAQNPKRHK
jgi:hypothetical protein